MSYLSELDPDNPLRPLQAASCTYRIALGLRAGQKVLHGAKSGRQKRARFGRSLVLSSTRCVLDGRDVPSRSGVIDVE